MYDAMARMPEKRWELANDRASADTGIAWRGATGIVRTMRRRKDEKYFGKQYWELCCSGGASATRLPRSLVSFAETLWSLRRSFRT